MNTLTVREAIAQTGIEVLEHLDREVQIPLIVGPQAQGDVLVIPTPASSVATTAVPRVGVAVVRGEVGGNTHTLLAESGPVFFDQNAASDTDLVLGTLTVPVGSVALLAHPEHAFSRVGAGNFTVSRQREQADVIRMVQD